MNFEKQDFKKSIKATYNGQCGINCRLLYFHLVSSEGVILKKRKYSVNEKKQHYASRVGNKNLTSGQRDYARNADVVKR